jgi:hypothetical protein
MKSVSLPVSPGGTVTLTVDTGRTEVAEGTATFHLSRDGEDKDGDPAAGAVVPENNPTARYEAAKIDPAMGSEPVEAGVCEFDPEQDRSVQTFGVTADNTGSTLPVPFHVGGMTRTVAPGEIQRIEYPVVWGTGTVDLTAAGKTLATLDVSFESCAELTWPHEDVTVTTAAQCVDDWHIQHTAAVENRTGRDWLGVLVREGSGEVGAEKQVGAGTTTTLDLTRDTPFSGEGNVTVRLTRELEGESFTVERSFPGGSAACSDGDEEVCEPTATPTPTASTDPSNDGWLAPLLPGYCGDD